MPNRQHQHVPAFARQSWNNAHMQLPPTRSSVSAFAPARQQDNCADDEADDARCPHAPLPAHGLGEASGNQRRSKATQVVRNVPHTPVRASLWACKPGGQDASAARPTHSLRVAARRTAAARGETAAKSGHNDVGHPTGSIGQEVRCAASTVAEPSGLSNHPGQAGQSSQPRSCTWCCRGHWCYQAYLQRAVQAPEEHEPGQ